MMTPAIEIEAVSFRYDGPIVLDGVNLAVEQGEFLGIVGPNGGGKTTLLKLALGLIEPAQGRIRVLGRTPHEARRAIGYVPQFASFRRDFPISVEETVLLGRLGLAPMIGCYTKADRAAAESALAQTEMLGHRKRAIAALSGGELQRVLIARALASDPKILLLDEPTANIDLRVESEIFDLLKRINARATVVVVTHDIGFISRYVTRVACLNRTLVCHTTSEITGEVIAELYGRPVRMVRHTPPEMGGAARD
jgi:zinc transport system ATP-binding protein